MAAKGEIVRRELVTKATLSRKLYDLVDNTGWGEKKVSIEEVESLINQGADVNYRDNIWGSILHRAVCNSQCVDIVECLLKHGADPNCSLGNIHESPLNDQTPLHIAAKKGNTKAVKLLLEYNADIEASDISGCSPLFAAVFTMMTCSNPRAFNETIYNRNIGAIKFLVAHGANIFHPRRFPLGQEKTQATPFSVASIETRKTLLSCRAEISAMTFLMCYLCSEKNNSSLSLLSRDVVLIVRDYILGSDIKKASKQESTFFKSNFFPIIQKDIQLAKTLEESEENEKPQSCCQKLS